MNSATHKVASHRRQWRFVAVIVATLALLVPGVAGATLADAAQPHLTVDSYAPAELWQGEVARQDRTYNVPECQTGCDRLKLKVNLPSRITQRSGGVQVAIRWSGSFDDNLGLYLYRGRDLVAKADAVVATAQSMLIPFAHGGINGHYWIYVANRTPDVPTASPAIRYEGLAEVEFNPPKHPRRDLLPDLISIPPPAGGVTFDNPGTIFGDTAPAGSSCFLSEIEEQGASVCLRFDNISANIGEGPVDLRFDRAVGGPLQNEPVWQRIYRSSGGPNDFYERGIGEVEYHPIHDHYHFVGYSLSQLLAIQPDGTPGAPVAVGQKVSFCMADTAMHAFGEKGDGPQDYPAPDCLEPKFTENGREFFSQGMSRLRADRYDWFLPDQMIPLVYDYDEVPSAQMLPQAGVPDGRYFLHTTIDPDNLLQEANNRNNCSLTLIELTGMGTNTPTAQVIGAGPVCISR